MTIDSGVFRSYDIRGIVDSSLTASVVKQIGQAFGSEVVERGEQASCVVGRDGRLSSPAFSRAVINGLRAAGVDVIDVGLVPTPVLYFAGYLLEASSTVMVTGSHNPVNYNGLKFSLNQYPFAGNEISGLKQRLLQDAFAVGNGDFREENVLGQYVRQVADHFALERKLHIVVDCGNGASGVLMRKLLDELNVDYTLLYEEVDGTFPNHHPDPCVTENLTALVQAVTESGADLGIAFDGDGDRLGVVSEKGGIVAADQLLALFASDVLSSQKGQKVVFDVKCGYCVRNEIERLQGVSVLSPTGHTNIKSLIREHGAVLGGELSGHICFPDRWYSVDDAAYAAVRVLELISKSGKSLSELISNYEQWVSTEELFIDVDDQSKFEIVKALQADGRFEGGNRILMDGVRVEYEDGWGLVRASNTNPVLSLRFEADDEEALSRVRDRFALEIADVAPDLIVPIVS